MVALDRQEIIATNKSLRLIKNELEHLLEKGVLSDDIFDQINSVLPAETSLSGGSNAPTPAPVRSSVASPPPPTNGLANLAINANPSPNPAPPAYSSTGPPSLPARNNPAAPAPPQKPVIANARALYKYAAADDRDLSFEKDDQVQVHEYMNDDWWMGRNARTGAEGIFPKNYVHVEDQKQPPQLAPWQNAATPVQQQQGGYPAPPPSHNPYNAHVPPVAVAEGSGGGANSKVNENGKKFGKKLGNAAIFGAGATIGGKIVNGIF